MLSEETKQLIIDQEWYIQESLLTSGLEEFTASLNLTIILKNFHKELLFPHQADQKTQLFMAIYNFFEKKFSYLTMLNALGKKLDINKTCENRMQSFCFDGLKILVVSLKGFEVTFLKEKYLVKYYSNSKITKEEVEMNLENLSAILKSIIEKSPDGIFVKNEMKSNIFIQPLLSDYEVFEILSSSQDIYNTCFNDDNHLIISPFIRDLDSDWEFRVFIFDFKVAAISKQKWHKKLPQQNKISVDMINKIIRLWEKIVSKLKISNIVLHVYFDSNKEVHLIECNPGSAWGRSRSALFHWVNDKEVMEANEVSVRMYLESK